MGFDMGSVLQALGAERMGLQLAGLSSGQIDAIEHLRETYPAVNELDLAGVMTDEDLADIKQEVLQIVEDPQLAEKFGQTIEADPELAQRINALVHDDPQKLGQVIDGFREEPGSLSALLKEQVTEQQVAAQVARSAERQNSGNFLQNMQGQLGEMMNGFSWENIGAALLAVFNGITGMVENLMGGIQKFMQGDEFVIDGNGGPNGPMAQVAQMFGINAEGHQQNPDGTIVSGPVQDGTRPETAEPATAPQPTPEQEQQLAQQGQQPQRDAVPGMNGPAKG